MARRKTDGEIRGQLEISHEIVQQFRFRTRGWGRSQEIEPGYGPVTILPTHLADGRGVPKYRPVRYNDWIKEQTRPWRREPDRDIAWFLAKYKGTEGFEYEEVAYEVVPDSKLVAF